MGTKNNHQVAFALVPFGASAGPQRARLNNPETGPTPAHTPKPAQHRHTAVGKTKGQLRQQKLRPLADQCRSCHKFETASATQLALKVKFKLKLNSPPPGSRPRSAQNHRPPSEKHSPDPPPDPPGGMGDQQKTKSVPKYIIDHDRTRNLSISRF
jgi:hypothetical protein